MAVIIRCIDLVTPKSTRKQGPREGPWGLIPLRVQEHEDHPDERQEHEDVEHDDCEQAFHEASVTLRGPILNPASSPRRYKGAGVLSRGPGPNCPDSLDDCLIRLHHAADRPPGSPLAELEDAPSCKPRKQPHETVPRPGRITMRAAVMGEAHRGAGGPVQYGLDTYEDGGRRGTC